MCVCIYIYIHTYIHILTWLGSFQHRRIGSSSTFLGALPPPKQLINNTSTYK